MAKTWASRCEWKHDQPKLDVDPPFRTIGQNLYMISGVRSINLTAGIQAWYDEKSDYNYESQACSKVCGHYTQVPRPYS